MSNSPTKRSKTLTKNEEQQQIHYLEKAKTYEQLYKSEKQRNEVLKAKMREVESKFQDLEDKCEGYEILERENQKYQELVEKFEQQQQFKDDEFQSLKSQISGKFKDNEQTIHDLKLQLQQQKDFTYNEQLKFQEELQKVQNKLKAWEKDCERLEQLKRSNEQIIKQMREDFKRKEEDYLKQIEQLNYSQRDLQVKLQKSQGEKDNFQRELLDLEGMVQKFVSGPQTDLEKLVKDLERTREELEREKSKNQQMKEGMQSSMDRILHEKNYIQADQSIMKKQMGQNNELIKRQDQTIKELLGYKQDSQYALEKLKQENADLEREISRTAQLLQEMTEAQQITCSKFSEFQKDIKNLQAENRHLREQLRERDLPNSYQSLPPIPQAYLQGMMGGSKSFVQLDNYDRLMPKSSKNDQDFQVNRKFQF